MAAVEPARHTSSVDVDDLASLDRDMLSVRTEGYWSKADPDVTITRPITNVRPQMWRWVDVFPNLVRAGELVGLDQAERRTARLLNEGLLDTSTRFTTHTMQASLQYLKPGERAQAHHHTQAGIRFVTQGSGAYTTTNGQRCVMETGDLILTPQLAWHDHANESDQVLVWLDGLDLPLIKSLNQVVFEPYYKAAQDVTIDSDEIRPLFGAARPASGQPNAFFHYKWRDTYAALTSIGAEGRPPDPFDGHLLEYINPTTGGPTLPTMQCTIQLLPPRHDTQAHRHTSTVIYHVAQGSGATFIEGERFDWQRGDTLVVPVWHTHRHSNPSPGEDAILFSMSDAPVLRALELYREESDTTPLTE
jgi:gentisate 1,2-dioxygenase